MEALIFASKLCMQLLWDSAPGVGHLDLEIPVIAALERVYKGCSSDSALDWEPLATPAPIASACKVHVPSQALWAAVCDCSTLVMGLQDPAAC